MLKPHISDDVRGFGVDDLELEYEYAEWEQAGKPECVNPIKCPRGMRRAAREVGAE
tara:strand:+ start:280 stop:447 length:168 start_codon:yes stop_codon:yes gene_type:complete